MTIVLFLVDTSASMLQRAAVGTHFVSYIDLAKEAIEAFVKRRVKNSAILSDRYMLLTFDDFPLNIKAGWKENMATFIRELNNLQCDSLQNLRQALINAFTVLNLNRVQTSLDNYGLGRFPIFLEPAIIIVITDGGKLCNPSQLGLRQDLNLPMPLPIPGHELTYEPFRWDHRVFSLVLRLPGAPIGILDCDAGIIPRDDSPINGFCEATGGRSYRISTHRMLMQCIESLILKVHRGVVISFEKVGSDPPLEPALNNKSRVPSGPTNWHTCRTLLQVPKAESGIATSFWPIPESFWPDSNFPLLPQRSAQPVIQFSCTNQKPLVLGNLPFDKYVLEPSHLTRYILSRKQPGACWQVFIANSCRPTSPQGGFPFGYLKANSNITCVHLYVLPYNYPALLPLLDMLFKKHLGYPTEDWIIRFKGYLRNMPCYYADHMRKALIHLGLPEYLTKSLIPSLFDAPFSREVLSYVKQIRVETKAKLNELCIAVETRVSSNNESLVSKKASSIRPNPFDFQRASLCDELVRLRSMFFHPFVRQPLNESSVPCNRMGDYLSYALNRPLPLRGLVPSPITKTELFGNPFKRDKKMIVDETDVDLVKSTRQHPDRSLGIQHFPGRNMLHRKRGPIPKHAIVCWTKHQPTSAAPPSEQLVLQPTLQLDVGMDLPTCEASNLIEINVDGVTPSCLFPKLHQVSDGKTLGELSLNHGNVEFACRSRKPTRVRDAGIHMNCTTLGCSTKSELDHIVTQNKSIMLAIKREVRKPGKISAQLISLVKSLQGNYRMKVKLIGDVIKELQRFKRRIMIEQVKDVFYKEMKDVIVDYTQDENTVIQQALHIEPMPN